MLNLSVLYNNHSSYHRPHKQTISPWDEQEAQEELDNKRHSHFAPRRSKRIRPLIKVRSELSQSIVSISPAEAEASARTARLNRLYLQTSRTKKLPNLSVQPQASQRIPNLCKHPAIVEPTVIKMNRSKFLYPLHENAIFASVRKPGESQLKKALSLPKIQLFSKPAAKVS